MADIWLVRKRLPQAAEGVAAILTLEGRQRFDLEKEIYGSIAQEKSVVSAIFGLACSRKICHILY